MEIIFINPAVNECVGGTEVFIREIAARLAERHKITVLTGRIKNGPDEKIWKSVERLQLSYINRASLFARIGAKGRRWILPIDFESVSLFANFLCSIETKKRIRECDCIATFYPTDSLLFSRYAAKRGIPALYHCNGWGGPPIICWQRFFKYDKSKIYLAQSHTSKEQIERRCTAKFDGIVTPGIPADIFDTHSKRHNDKKVLLYVGRLVKMKGIFKILQIYKELSNSSTNLRLVFLGDGDAKQELEMKIDKENIKNVSVIGKVPPDRVYDYYKQADLFLSASEYESFGMTILEAMAAGLPVICSDLPATREVTAGTAILLQKDTMSEWIQAAKKILDDEDYMQKIIKKQRLVAKNHLWDIKAREFEGYLYMAVERMRH